MKIGVISDLHIHDSEYNLPFPECDIIVLAGDIVSIDSPDKSDRNFLKKLEKEYNGHVIRIFGNDEFRNMDAYYIDNSICQYVEYIDNIRFICATGWVYQENLSLWQQAKPDFNISMFCFEVINMFALQDKAFIESQLTKKYNGKTIVVTHFPPIEGALSKSHYLEKKRSCHCLFFDYLLKTYQPDMWIHGHCHQTHDFKFEKTRIVCNGKGHKNKENPDFNPLKIINF